MQTKPTDPRQRLITGVFLLMWCLGAVLLGFHVHSQNGWVLGDWMIDYRQGFVRRGLLASVLAPLAHATGLPVAGFIAALLTAVLGACLFLFARVLSGRIKPFWYMLLLLSPAGLIFNVYGASQVGRKELLHFCMLALFVWLLDQRRLNARWALALSAMAAVAALSHEMMLFYVPYFFVAAYWSRQGRQAYVGAGAVAVGSGLAVLALTLFAQPFDGQAFCASLVSDDGAATSMCQGTILWPIQTVAASLADTWLAIGYFQYPLVYGLALMLALAPVLFWLRRYDRAVLQRTWASIGFAVVCSAPLFFLAVDWGRFIQIHLVSCAMVLALLLRKQGSVLEPAALPAGGASGVRVSSPLIPWRSGWAKQLAFGVTLLVGLVWNMPVCCQASVGMGLVEKIGNAQTFMAVVHRYWPQ